MTPRSYPPPEERREKPRRSPRGADARTREGGGERQERNRAGRAIGWPSLKRRGRGCGDARLYMARSRRRRRRRSEEEVNVSRCCHSSIPPTARDRLAARHHKWASRNCTCHLQFCTCQLFQTKFVAFTNRSFSPKKKDIKQ